MEKVPLGKAPVVTEVTPVLQVSACRTPQHRVEGPAPGPRAAGVESTAGFCPSPLEAPEEEVRAPGLSERPPRGVAGFGVGEADGSQVWGVSGGKQWEGTGGILSKGGLRQGALSKGHYGSSEGDQMPSLHLQQWTGPSSLCRVSGNSPSSLPPTPQSTHRSCC